MAPPSQELEPPTNPARFIGYEGSVKPTWQAEVHGQIVTAVLGQRVGAAGWQKFAVVMDDRAMILLVGPDTDEIAVEVATAPETSMGWLAVADLSGFLGSELGWCWVGRNYRGYLDMFTLSFSGLEPQVCFVGEGATIRIRRILQAS